MTQKNLIKPDRDTKDETKAGSYFVSNYPPFSAWNEKDAAYLPACSTSFSRHGSLGLYYHVPFCRKRCHFCYFRVYTDKNSNDVRRYLSATMKELRAYAEVPYLKGRKPKFVYFGGGTPSYLSAQQLTQLTDEMKSILPWDEAEEVTFECEPGTLSEKKLEAIKNFGVTRLSLGIENFDDHILETNGRAHRSKEVFRAYEFARQLGFDNINADLISEMLEETDDNWSDCIDQVIDLSPDCVTIYQMEVPFNTTIFKSMKEQGVSALRLPIGGPKGAGSMRLTGVSKQPGTRSPPHIRRSRIRRKPNSFIGIVFGRVRTWLLWESHPSDTWEAFTTKTSLTSISIAKPPRAKVPSSGGPFSPRMRNAFVRELILQWKLGVVRPSYFRDKFGIDILARFSEVFEEWRASGDLIAGEDELRLSRAALLRVDSMLYRFFFLNIRIWTEYLLRKCLIRRIFPPTLFTL